MNKFTLSLRGMAIVFLLICLALPLSKCSEKAVLVEQEGSTKTERITKDDLSAQSSSEKITFIYVFSYLDSKDLGGLLIVFAFVWPLFMLPLFRYVRKVSLRKILTTIEVLLCAGSLFAIYRASSVGERLFGAYLAFFAFGLYLVASLVDLGSWVKAGTRAYKT